MEMDIFWSDLTRKAQCKMLKAAGIDMSPEDYAYEMNVDYWPIASFELDIPEKESE